MFPLSEADGTTFTLFYIGIDVFPGNCASSIQLGINATLISSNNGQTLVQKPFVYYQLGDEITVFTNSTGDPIELVTGNTVLASITTDGADLGLFFNPNFTPPDTSGAETSFAPLYGAANELCAKTAQWAVGSGRGSATSDMGLAGFPSINFTDAEAFANSAASFEPSNGLLLGLVADSSVVVEVNAATAGVSGGGSIEFGVQDKC